MTEDERFFSGVFRLLVPRKGNGASGYRGKRVGQGAVGVRAERVAHFHRPKSEVSVSSF